MKKFMSAVLTLVLLVSLCCMVPSAEAKNATIRNRKIVSVVYDDSGSMDGEKWEYTSYAMQCFAAMLNKEDRLDITYMSSYQNGSYQVDTNNRAQSVQQIRDHTDRSGKTPVAAVQTGFDTLSSVADDNVNTQYWLIVMTDGQMNGAKEKVDELAEKKMPNGTKPHIVFLTLCDTEGKYTPSFNKSNIESRSAKTADEIISVISDIACNIAGRFPAEKAAIKSISDTTVEVTTDLPLFNMGILSQRSTAQIVSVQDKDGAALQNEGNVPVKAPDKFINDLPAEAQRDLNGNVALFSNPGGNIQAGTYTVTFSEPVSAEDLVVMFEPAFDLRLEISVNGQVVTDPTLLEEADVINVDAVLYESGTDNKIALGMLPSGRQSHISYSEGGQVVAEGDTLKLSDLTLKPLETEISASLSIPGFFTVSDTVRFNPIPTVLSNMTAELYYDGSERMTDENGNPDPNNVVYVTSMSTNKTGIAYTLYIEGLAINKSQAEAILPRFRDRLSLDFPNYDIAITDDGKFIVYPTAHGMLLDLLYYWNYGGDHTVSCTFDGFTAGGELTFKLGDWWTAWWPAIHGLLHLAVLIYLLLWIFWKPHFTRCKLTASKATAAGNEYNNISIKRVYRNLGFFSSSGLLNFIGLAGMKRRIKSTKFRVRATRGGGWQVEGVKNMRVSTSEEYPDDMVSQYEYSAYEFDQVVYFAYDNPPFYRIKMEPR